MTISSKLTARKQMTRKKSNLVKVSNLALTGQKSDDADETALDNVAVQQLINSQIQSYTQGTAQILPLSLVLQNVFCQP